MKLGGSRSCNSLDPTYATGWLPFGAIFQFEPFCERIQILAARKQNPIPNFRIYHYLPPQG
jgi:hypothetical protein